MTDRSPSPGVGRAKWGPRGAGLERFPVVEVDAAAEILAVLRDLPPVHRMNAMAMACDAFVKIEDRAMWGDR